VTFESACSALEDGTFAQRCPTQPLRSTTRSSSST